MPANVERRIACRLFLCLFCMKLTSDFCELSQKWLVVERRVKDTKYV